MGFPYISSSIRTSDKRTPFKEYVSIFCIIPVFYKCLILKYYEAEDFDRISEVKIIISEGAELFKIVFIVKVNSSLVQIGENDYLFTLEAFVIFDCVEHLFK